MEPNNFYKNNEDDIIWWVETPDTKGEFLFSFDRITVYNLFQDYEKLSDQQREIFNKENPMLAELFIERG